MSVMFFFHATIYDGQVCSHSLVQEHKN